MEPPLPGSNMPDEVAAVGPSRVVDQAMIAVLASELNRLAVRYWLMGGWAVDGHVGRVTRGHSDIDFAVCLDDRPSFVAAVAAHGCTPTPGAEPAGEFFAGGPRPLEVTYLVATPDGEVVTPGFEHWPYLAGSFDDERIDIAGVPVPVMSIEGLLDTRRTGSIKSANRHARTTSPTLMLSASRGLTLRREFLTGRGLSRRRSFPRTHNAE